MTETYLTRIGGLIRDARRHKGMTQSELAELLGTSQSAVTRIEQGQQNLSLDMLAKIGDALDSEFVSLGHSGPQHLRIVGGRSCSGSIDVKTSKNAAVALLCARCSTAAARRCATWPASRRSTGSSRCSPRSACAPGGSPAATTSRSSRRRELDLDAIDVAAARRTRTVIMFLGPLLHDHAEFRLPYAGGCDLGTRTVEPHLAALRAFGLEVTATHGFYEASSDRARSPTAPIVLTERGDTVTENVLMAAARHDGMTVIRNASPNYMVQDLCFFLERLGVRIEGIGTTTLDRPRRSPTSTSTSSTPPARTRSRR